MVGIHESVCLLQVEQLVNLSGKHKTVATHQELIGWYREYELAVIEMLHLYQRTAIHFRKPSFLDGLSDKLVIRRHQQFHCVLRGSLESRLRRLTVGQQLSHRNDGEHADAKAEDTGDRRSQHVHRRTRLLSIEPRDNQVWRRTDQRTHTAHARSIAQRYQQFRGRDIQFLRPHFDDTHEEGDHSGVAEE